MRNYSKIRSDHLLNFTWSTGTSNSPIHNMFHNKFLAVGLMIVMICSMGPTCDHFCYGTNRLAIFFIVPQNNVFKIMCSIESSTSTSDDSTNKVKIDKNAIGTDLP